MLQSPVLDPSGRIPAGYVCSQNVWLPLRWGVTPPDTEELVLYVGGFGSPRNFDNGAKFTPLVAASLVVGLSPKLHSLSVGVLPAGTSRLVEAHVPVCPPRIAGREFVFRLFALPRAHYIDKSALRSESPYKLLKKLYREGLAEGEFTTSYSS
jgi:phosphatidylethanolamine-binding protein (PEBP) family uncharacterized protein